MNNYQLSIKNYQLYKDSGVAWLGDVPEHWEVKRVKDIVKRIGNGVTPRGGSEVYTDFGVVFLRSQNVYDDGLRIDNVSFIPEKIHEEMKSSQLETGDILINITGASIGRTCLFSLKSGSANINQHIAFLRTKFWINEFYISLFLKSHFIKNYIEIEQNGASKEAFNLSQIANIPLVLPSQLEQKSIAHYLDTKTAQCDRKIDLLTQKATQYGKLKQSLINETVTRGLDKSVPMKDSGVEWIGEIPEHWKVKRFKEIFNKTHSGWTPDTTKQESFEGSNIWVTIRDMNDIYISDSLNKLSDQAIRESGISLTPKGSLLFSFKLSIGKIAFAGCDLYTNEAIISIEEGKNINLNYFYYTLPVFLILNAKENIYGAKLLNQSLIFNTSLLYPPLSEQKAIADYLDTKTAQIDQIIQAINTQIEKLKELRKTLINDVVTGKIKVIDN
jgi:type I restriction enzyme S subunit